MSSSSHLRAAPYFILLVLALTVSGTPARAQSLGNAGTVSGVVTDPNGAVVPNATVTISNPVTGYTRTVNADADGSFRFNDVPPNNYHITVSAAGFDAAHQDLTVRQSVPISLKIPLTVGGTSETVTVTSGNVSDVIENVTALDDSAALPTLEGIKAVNMMRKGQIKRLAGSNLQGQAKFVETLFGVAA
jgi:hypothetical protein